MDHYLPRCCTAADSLYCRRGGRRPLLGELAMNKREVLEIIDHLPEQIDPEQLMTELYLKAKLDRAEAAVTREEVISHEEVVQRSRQWSE